MKIIIDFIKLSDKLNLIEKSEELPCGIEKIWDLLENTSDEGHLIDNKNGIDPVKKLTIDMDAIREKTYYYTGLKKKQREYLIELLLKYKIGG